MRAAYTPQSINLAYVSAAAVPGPYVIPAYDMRVSVVETNKVAALSVRGAGYPEGTFAMERVLDRIAKELNMDRVEVRDQGNSQPITGNFGDRSANLFAKLAKLFDLHVM